MRLTLHLILDAEQHAVTTHAYLLTGSFERNFFAMRG